MSESKTTKLPRFGAQSYGLKEMANGSWLAIIDVVKWLDDLTDDDNAEAMIGKIDAMKRELQNYDN